MESGKFVISLDFELYWGVRDKRTLDQYGGNLLGVRKVIPALIQAFGRYDISATFATVGLLFFDDKRQLLACLPASKPAYINKALSPYADDFALVGNDENDDPYHFAPSLIRLLQQAGQEIGCHTFCHYYCLEAGQTIDAFREDLRAARSIAAAYQIDLHSLVFPRNQFNEAYISVCEEMNISAYRGNERSWIYQARTDKDESLWRRVFRLADAYINISGHHTYRLSDIARVYPYNIPSSRLLRSHSGKLKMLDGLKLRRIKRSMTFAAKNNRVYHLWWHPHNFGVNLEQNMDFLERILEHYAALRERYAFESASMHQLTTYMQEAYAN